MIKDNKGAGEVMGFSTSPFHLPLFPHTIKQKPMDKRQKIIAQIELQNKVVKLAGVNIVTCGHCGSIVLHDIKAEEIDCPYCDKVMEVCDCPDYLYDNIENNLEFNN